MYYRFFTGVLLVYYPLSFVGWDVDTGDEADGLKPEFLVSISAPKKCAKFFQGLYHYMGGRFLPRTLEQKFDLHLPSFPGTDCVMELKTQKTPEEEKSNGNGE